MKISAWVLDAAQEEPLNKKLIRRWDSERELPYHDIVHALQNAIDLYINSATDRHRYVLEHRFTKFSEITHVTAITPFKFIQGHRF